LLQPDESWILRPGNAGGVETIVEFTNDDEKAMLAKS